MMNDAEILYDHYKDTVIMTKNEENRRNKIFVVIMIHLLLLFLITIKPESIYNMILELLKENFQTSFYFSINVLQIFVMISIFYCTMRYYQFNIHIEKMYTYLHKIEENLSKQISGDVDREGRNYLYRYPKTLDVIYFSYKYFFPILYTMFLVSRLIINNTWDNWKIKLLEIIITLILIALNGLYIFDTVEMQK